MNPRLLAKVALALLATLVALGAAEVAVRVADVEINTNPRLRYHPDLGWTINPGYRRYDQINPDGFRHLVPPGTAEGRRRLLILGDSFTFGGAYPYARTYAGRLQEWLGAAVGDPAEKPWDVINLGVSGYGTGQQLLALEEYGLSFEPDAVVLQMFPYNDLCNNNLEQAFTCSFLDFHRPYFVTDDADLRITYLHPIRARLRRFSRLFGWVEVRTGWGIPVPEIDSKGDAKRAQYLLKRGAASAGLEFESNRYSLVPEELQPESIRAGWEVTERIVGEIAARLDERDTPLIGVVVPYFDTLRPRWPGLKPRGHPRLVADHATDRAERILGDVGASVISVRERILAGDRRPKEYFFPRPRREDKHFNVHGHEMIAIWILEELRDLGLTERVDTPVSREEPEE
jgi:hypothetical protein